MRPLWACFLFMLPLEVWLASDTVAPVWAAVDGDDADKKSPKRFKIIFEHLLRSWKLTSLTKVLSEKPKTRVSDIGSTSHGTLHRPVLVQQQHQQQQQYNSENMVTLHARLLQEAEKIRKWKIQTELDLKEKLQNEKTSAKLEEEITNKGEVLKRIDATREMCNLLKSHASCVLDRLTRCETEKTELKYSNKEQGKQFQELTMKFKNLQIQVTDNEKTRKNQADKARLEQIKKEDSLKTKLIASEEQDEKSSLEKKVQGLEVDFSSLQTSKDNLLLQMNESTSSLTRQLQQAQNESSVVRMKLDEEQKRLASLRKGKKTTFKTFVNQPKQIKNNLMAEKEESKEEIHNLNGEISVLNKKLDRESLCRAQAQDESEVLQEKITALESMRHVNDEQVNSLKTEIDMLQVMKLSKEDLQQKVDSSAVYIEELKSSLKDSEQKVQELTNQLDDVTEQHKESDKSLTAQQKKAAVTGKLNKELEKEVKTLKSKLEKESKLSQQRSDEVSAMQEEMSLLKELKTEAEVCMQNCNEKMELLQRQCEKDQKEAKLAIQKAKEIQLSAEKEKENAKALTDCQLTEMMSTLETYKQNNERLISEKDVEMEAMRAQIQNQKLESLEEWATKTTELHAEKDELKGKISALESQINHLKMQVNHNMQEKHTPLMRNHNMQEKHTPLMRSMGHQSPPVVEVTPQKQQIPHTPLPMTPKMSTIPKTPSRSILRVVNSETKRRKVAFSADNASPSSSEESELMELDPEAALLKKHGTPVLFTPTHKAESKLMTGLKPVQLNRKPRGPSVTQVHLSSLSLWFKKLSRQFRKIHVLKLILVVTCLRLLIWTKIAAPHVSRGLNKN
ncbi:synaptonemal complex protein 1-like [Plakobranchus ocellatus]|uniref:Synaptonemal complex protein 1-like n=1 Tax=Plakobranchus ocellatus TaxID=259542 RepID=A0AAV4BVQ3_9GAST|nr:synaptonemal complex protein 1-like [Plakobranchus ocellatus]